jgi:hypothetical protein
MGEISRYIGEKIRKHPGPVVAGLVGLAIAVPTVDKYGFNHEFSAKRVPYYSNIVDAPVIARGNTFDLRDMEQGRVALVPNDKTGRENGDRRLAENKCEERVIYTNTHRVDRFPYGYDVLIIRKGCIQPSSSITRG